MDLHFQPPSGLWVDHMPGERPSSAPRSDSILPRGVGQSGS